MLAGCPPAGGVLLAQRLLLLHTASPICFSAKGFERHQRCRTLWHGACFALRACVHRCSAAPCRAPVCTAHAHRPLGERDAHCLVREKS